MASPDLPVQELGSDRSLSVSFDGGGVAPSAGTTYRMYVPYSCIVESAVIVSDVPGYAVVDIWVVAYPSIPVQANSIVASDPPTLSNSQTHIDTSLTGWSKTIPAGSNVFFSLTSASVLTSFTLTLKVGV
jgi:heme/copper-type cytochrome/quinol oxidase subunit 2